MYIMYALLCIYYIYIYIIDYIKKKKIIINDLTQLFVNENIYKEKENEDLELN